MADSNSTARANSVASPQGTADAAWAVPVARRYELRIAGLIYIATTLFTAIGAFNSQNNLLFWAFGIGVAGLIISGVVSGSALMGLRARRYVGGDGTVGEKLDLRYLVVSRNGFIPAAALLIRELPATPPAGTLVGRVSAAAATVPFLRAGGRSGVRATPIAEARGPITFDRFEVSTGFPFGLVSKSIVFSQPARAVLRPARVRIREGLLVASGLGRSRALVPGGRSGAGSEIFGLREYAPGDSPRTIAWRRSAASETLLVREFADPSPPVVCVVIDARSLGVPGGLRFERAVALAGELLRRALERGHAVALELTATAERLGPTDDPRIARRMTDRLALLDADETSGRARAPGGRDGQTILIGETTADGFDRHTLRLDPMATAAWLAPGADLPAALRAVEATA